MKGKEEKCQRPPPDSEVVRSVMHLSQKETNYVWASFSNYSSTGTVPQLFCLCVFYFEENAAKMPVQSVRRDRRGRAQCGTRRAVW